MPRGSTSHDLATVVDPVGNGAESPGSIDRGEAAACIQEAMHYARGVGEISHDLAAVVNPLGLGGSSPGDIDGGEAAARIQEAMYTGAGGHGRDLESVLLLTERGRSHRTPVQEARRRRSSCDPPGKVQ